MSLTQSGVCVVTCFTMGSFYVIPEGQRGSPGTGREINLCVLSLDGINGRVKRRDAEREPKKEGRRTFIRLVLYVMLASHLPSQLLSHYK